MCQESFRESSGRSYSWTEDEKRRLDEAVKKINNGQLYKSGFSLAEHKFIKREVGLRSLKDVAKQLLRRRKEYKRQNQMTSGHWKQSEIELLKICVRAHGRKVKKISEYIPTKNTKQIRHKIDQLVRDQQFSPFGAEYQKRSFKQWTYQEKQRFCEGIAIYFEQPITVQQDLVARHMWFAKTRDQVRGKILKHIRTYSSVPRVVEKVFQIVKIPRFKRKFEDSEAQSQFQQVFGKDVYQTQQRDLHWKIGKTLILSPIDGEYYRRKVARFQRRQELRVESAQTVKKEKQIKSE